MAKVSESEVTITTATSFVLCLELRFLVEYEIVIIKREGMELS